MRVILSVVMMFSVALLALAGCQNATSSTKTEIITNNIAPAAKVDENSQEVPRINLADAKKDFDAGITYFIDTRNEESYKSEHIKGAVNISENMLEAKIKNIPKDKKIIAYCS